MEYGTPQLFMLHFLVTCTLVVNTHTRTHTLIVTPLTATPRLVYVCRASYINTRQRSFTGAVYPSNNTSMVKVYIARKSRDPEYILRKAFTELYTTTTTIVCKSTD